MKIDHKDNFLATFAYQKAERGNKDAIKFNIIKGLAYIPIIGAMAQLIFVAFAASVDNKTPTDKALLAAVSGRFALSLACPFVLPLIDTVASIWNVVDERKHK